MNGSGYAPNPRKRAEGMQLSRDAANRSRDSSGGRFRRSPPCDFCGKSCAASHYTDDRACGSGDGPGFYLCGKPACERARAKLEREQGFEALKQSYAEQRRANDSRESAPFMDGPKGTERELEKLRKDQRIVVAMLGRTTERDKVESLQRKELDLQRRIDRLVFGDEQVPNASRAVKTHLLVLGGFMPSCNRMGRLASGHQAVKLNEFIKLPPEERCERCEPFAATRLERALEAQRAKKNLLPNHAAVHYVWLIDYRGVPMDTEGPYGPMSLTRAEAFARIGAKEGDHDRVVSIGDQVMSDDFEIVRRYRRGTGERIL